MRPVSRPLFITSGIGCVSIGRVVRLESATPLAARNARTRSEWRLISGYASASDGWWLDTDARQMTKSLRIGRFAEPVTEIASPARFTFTAEPPSTSAEKAMAAARAVGPQKVCGKRSDGIRGPSGGVTEPYPERPARVQRPRAWPFATRGFAPDADGRVAFAAAFSALAAFWAAALTM